MYQMRDNILCDNINDAYTDIVLITLEFSRKMKDGKTTMIVTVHWQTVSDTLPDKQYTFTNDGNRFVLS